MPRKFFRSRRKFRKSRFRPKGARGRGSYRSKVHPRRKATQVIIRQPSGVPDRLYVKLVYREQLAFTQATGNLADNVYRGNSIFDPDLTGTGGQPLTFDQWSGFYASYTVLGSKIRVDSMLNGGAGIVNNMHGVCPNIFSTAFGTADQERVEEQPYSKHRAITCQGAGIGRGTITSYMSSAKIWGVKRPAIQIEDGYSALISTNPVNGWFWHVYNYVPGAQTQSMLCDVFLTYFVVFEGKNVLGTS